MAIFATNVHLGLTSYPEGSSQFHTINTLPPISSLSDISIWLVDYEAGKVLDRMLFKFEHFNISHHPSNSLCGGFFLYHSIQHQIIRIYRIQDRKFHLVNIIGTKYYMNDPNWHEDQLVGFKQKLVAFLYSQVIGSNKAISLFHEQLHQYMNLAIWKAQFLDADHLMIRLCPPENLRTKSCDQPPNQCIVIWNIPEVRVINFFHDSEMIELYEIANDYAREFRFLPDANKDDSLEFQPINTNSNWERQRLERTLEIYSSHRGSSEHLAKRKLVSMIPYSSHTQISNPSPFLDSELFRYNDRIISTVDRMKNAPDGHARFHSRETGRLVMRLDGNSTPEPSLRAKHVIQWIIHPFLPFAISWQLGFGSGVFNIHYLSE